MAYLLDFRLADRLLAGEHGHCVELVDVSVLVGGGKGLHGALDHLFLGVGMIAGENETGSAAHLEVGTVLALLCHCDHDQHCQQSQTQLAQRNHHND